MFASEDFIPTYIKHTLYQVVYPQLLVLFISAHTTQDVVTCIQWAYTMAYLCSFFFFGVYLAFNLFFFVPVEHKAKTLMDMSTMAQQFTPEMKWSAIRPSFYASSRRFVPTCMYHYTCIKVYLPFFWSCSVTHLPEIVLHFITGKFSLSDII